MHQTSYFISFIIYYNIYFSASYNKSLHWNRPIYKSKVSLRQQENVVLLLCNTYIILRIQSPSLFILSSPSPSHSDEKFLRPFPFVGRQCLQTRSATDWNFLNWNEMEWWSLTSFKSRSSSDNTVRNFTRNTSDFLKSNFGYLSFIWKQTSCMMTGNNFLSFQNNINLSSFS